jgi:hypothetical protein
MVKKLRAQHISIDLPTEISAPWVRVAIQTVYKNDDYETVQVVDRTAYTLREVSKIATEMTTLVDPVTQKELTISGAGAVTVVKKLIGKWIAEDHNGRLNEHDDIITED